MNRIDYISSLTSGYKSIADVGCDHAFISINAVTKFNVSYAYALDINDGPLENARMNIAASSLSDKIETIKSDGLINLYKDVEAIVIAGMGGSLIIKILSDSIGRAKASKCLILSPNNDEPLLREYLMNNGFKITNESIILDAKHYYEIIMAEPSNDTKLTKEDILFGPILRKEKSENFIKKYEKRLKVFESSLERCSDEKRKGLLDNTEALRRVLYGED